MFSAELCNPAQMQGTCMKDDDDDDDAGCLGGSVFLSARSSNVLISNQVEKKGRNG